MLLTKKALSAKTIEKFIEALASSCVSNAEKQYVKLGGKRLSAKIGMYDGPVLREVVPMSDLIASLVNLRDTNSLIHEVNEIYAEGYDLNGLLNNINPYSNSIILSSMHWNYEYVFEGVRRRVSMAEKVISKLRESGIEPNNYLPIIKMDVIQEAYIGRFP